MLQISCCICLTGKLLVYVVLLLSLLLMVHSAPTPASPFTTKELYKKKSENSGTPYSIIESTASFSNGDIKVSSVDKEDKSIIIKFILPKDDIQLSLSSPHQQNDINKEGINEKWIAPPRVVNSGIEQKHYISAATTASIPNMKATKSLIGSNTHESLKNSSIDSYNISGENTQIAETTPASAIRVHRQMTPSNSLIPLMFTTQPQSSYKSLSFSSLSNNDVPSKSSQATFRLTNPLTLKAENIDLKAIEKPNRYINNDFAQNNKEGIVEENIPSTSRDAILQNANTLKNLMNGIEPEITSTNYPLIKIDISNRWGEILSKSTSAAASVSSIAKSSIIVPYLKNSSNTDDDNLDDDIFDVIIDDNSSTTKTTSTEAVEESIDKLLEADSEEFFVPEDIKERETTTILATTTVVEVLPIDTEEPQITTDIDDKLLRPNPSTINHEADTIFYISNTEVKVVESVPTPNSNQESQFFPAIYEEDVIIDFSSKNFTGWVSIPDKYEEDIILSPLRNNFDTARMTAGGIDDSMSYIGESFIEVKEFTSDTSNPTTSVPPLTIPEDVQIGVPIIAELPPQIGSNIILYQQKQPSPQSIRNKELYVGVNQLPCAVVTEPNGNGLIQNSLQINQLNAELPLMMDDASPVKSIPAKRNNGQSNVTGGGVMVGEITSGPILSNTAFSVLDDEPEHSEFLFLGEYNIFSVLNLLGSFQF